MTRYAYAKAIVIGTILAMGVIVGYLFLTAFVIRGFVSHILFQH